MADEAEIWNTILANNNRENEKRNFEKISILRIFKNICFRQIFVFCRIAISLYPHIRGLVGAVRWCGGFSWAGNPIFEVSSSKVDSVMSNSRVDFRHCREVDTDLTSTFRSSKMRNSNSAPTKTP